MAFGVKYRAEFDDNEGETWRIDILEDGYASTITTMKLTGEPLVFEWPGISDDALTQYVRGSGASINVYAESDFAYSELFTSDNLEFKVNIYYDTTTLYWTGWVTSNVWDEPYSDTPYPVRISATDGLGILKEFDFSDLSLTDRETVDTIIHDILEQIEVDDFTEYVNVYHDSMPDQAVGNSPFDQMKIWTYLYKDNNCYEVLESILKIFNAAITQYKGEHIIYRYKELEDATMYGRKFTAPATKSAVTKTPIQHVNRSTTASNFKDTGGNLMIAPQIKTLNLLQTYGQRDSLFFGGDFSPDNFDGTDFTYWTISGGGAINTLDSITDVHEDGVIIESGNTAAAQTFYTQVLELDPQDDAARKALEALNGGQP